MCRGNTARCATNGICCSQGRHKAKIKLEREMLINYFSNNIYITYIYIKNICVYMLNILFIVKISYNIIYLLNYI